MPASARTRCRPISVAAAQAPQFVVIGGDLAYENGKVANVFLEFLKNYSRDVRDTAVV